MEFYDVVEDRKSSRSYKPNPIENEKLYRILESLTFAPSWSCQNCLRVLMVDEGGLIKNIAGCVNEENPAQEGLIEAPVVMVMCADPAGAEEIDSKEYYMCDCGIAMEHIMLAACSEGLATCWIGLFDEHKVKSILEIPDNIRLVAISPLGYRNEAGGTKKKKKSIKDIAYYQKWDNELVFKKEDCLTTEK